MPPLSAAGDFVASKATGLPPNAGAHNREIDDLTRLQIVQRIFEISHVVNPLPVYADAWVSASCHFDSDQAHSGWVEGQTLDNAR